MMLRGSGLNQRATLFLAALALGALGGCVERRYTIRTDPPGALVIVNNEEIGASPVSRSYVFYAERDITLIKEGYQTQRIIQPMPAPWWDSLPLEFFTENLIPITFRDEREFTYKLTPATNPPQEDLLGRAEGLRAQGQAIPPPRRGGILGFFGL
jgi:hypothetical protein